MQGWLKHSHHRKIKTKMTMARIVPSPIYMIVTWFVV